MAQRMYPLRIAVATRWARSPLPSLRAMRARWDLMVSAESPSCSPTCRFDFPSATIRRTWSSRSLRGTAWDVRTGGRGSVRCRRAPRQSALR